MIDFGKLLLDRNLDKQSKVPDSPTKEDLEGLTRDQAKAMELMSMLYDTFILKGYAGTGKTYLLNKFLARMTGGRSRVIITAPTHKAVAVANGDGTIHSYLSLSIKYKQDKQILQQRPFQDNIMFGDILVVDEASMVSKELLEYILDAQEMYELKVIFIGDPAQIPPVGEKESPVWEIDAPSFTLTEIVRQARDSNIISLATAVREGTAYTKGVSRFVNDKDVFMGRMPEMKKFFIKMLNEDEFPYVISYRNFVVDSANKWGRDIVKNKPEDRFLVGEEVYVRSVNDDQIHKLEDIVEIVDISQPFKFAAAKDQPMMVMNITIRSAKGEEDLIVPFSNADAKAFENNKKALAGKARNKQIPWGKFWKFANSVSELKHIYALTCHRSQGSTFRNVIVNCNDIGDQRLLYTAVTRASKRLFLFRD